jgi:hypothetical protein
MRHTSLLTRFLLPCESDGELRECIEQEATVWISSLTSGTMASFFKLIDTISIHHSWSQVAFVGKAWKKHKGKRKMHFSVLLVAALSDDDHSMSFVRFVGQVVARCMFILKDPVPLAEVIVHGGEQEQCTASSEIMKPLVEYARLLVNFDRENQKKATASLGKLLTAFFLNDSAYVHVFGSFSGTEKTSLEERCHHSRPNGFCDQFVRLELIHFLNHIFIVLPHTTGALERYRLALLHLLPALLQVRMLFTSDFESRSK